MRFIVLQCRSPGNKQLINALQCWEDLLEHLQMELDSSGPQSAAQSAVAARLFQRSFYSRYIAPSSPFALGLSPLRRERVARELECGAGAAAPVTRQAYVPVLEHCLKTLMKPWLEFLKSDTIKFLK